MRATLADADDLLAAGEFAHAASALREARAVRGYERNRDVLERWYRAGRGGRRTRLIGAWPAGILEGHSEYVTAVAVSNDGRVGVSGDSRGTVRLWDLVARRCLRTLESDATWISSVAVTPDGRLGLSGHGDRALTLWQLATGSCLHTLEGIARSVDSVAITADGRLGLSAGYVETGYELTTAGVKNEAAERWALELWDLDAGVSLRTHRHPTDIHSVALTADGRLGLCGGRGFPGTLMVWDLHTDGSLRMLEDDADVASVALTPDGRLGLSGHGDRTLRLWDLITGSRIRAFEAHTHTVKSIALTPDGRLGFSASEDDDALRLWDLETGTCLYTLDGRAEAVYTVALTPDGRLGMSGGSDGVVRLWEFLWDFEFPEPSDLDERARPQLELFLRLHAPSEQTDLASGIARKGKPSWSDDDLDALLHDLQDAGYGWLRREGVRAELERATAGGPAARWARRRRRGLRRR